MFYDALFDGVSVEEAFKTGVSALVAQHSAEAEYPCLKCRHGVDPQQVHIV